MSVTHVAGPAITVGSRTIQRCSVCGEKMLDSLGVMMAVGPNGEEPKLWTWEPGRLVRYSGEQPRRELLLPDTEQLPGDACIDLVE